MDEGIAGGQVRITVRRLPRKEWKQHGKREVMYYCPFSACGTKDIAHRRYRAPRPTDRRGERIKKLALVKRLKNK